MRQVWIPRVGGPEVLETREALTPEPASGQVRIRVRAAGVNFADILIRMGLYPSPPKLPAVVGYEVAGVVDALGDGVDGLKIGAPVLAMTGFGGYSDTVVLPAAGVYAIPEGLSFEKAAAIPVNYLTAWLMLIRLGNLQPGQVVLVHAVAGGVGQAALQICLWRGAKVIGTASGAKHARLQQLGVSHGIDYRSQDFEVEVARLTDGQGVDLALDAVGGSSFAKSYRCLGPLGRLFVFGSSSFAVGKKARPLALLKGILATPRFRPLSLLRETRGVMGVNLGQVARRPELLRAMMEPILEQVTKGVFDPVVDRSFAFEETGAAHAYIQARKNFGKVLLIP